MIELVIYIGIYVIGIPVAVGVDHAHAPRAARFDRAVLWPAIAAVLLSYMILKYPALALFHLGRWLHPNTWKQHRLERIEAEEKRRERIEAEYTDELEAQIEEAAGRVEALGMNAEEFERFSEFFDPYP